MSNFNFLFVFLEQSGGTMIEVKRGLAGRRTSVTIEMASGGEIGDSSSRTPKTETHISEVLKYWLKGLMGVVESSRISINERCVLIQCLQKVIRKTKVLKNQRNN